MKNFLNKGELVVPTADTTANSYLMDVIGNKTDAAVSAATTDKSLMGYIKGILTDTAVIGALGAGLTALATQTSVDAIADSVGSPAVIKAVTFSNTAAGFTLFTVTGDVKVKVIAICKTTCASAAGANVSIKSTSGAAGSIIAVTDVTLIAQNEIWHDATPDSQIELTSVEKDYILSGSDNIDFGLEPAKQVDSGAITFYCFWTPLSADGAVVAA